MPSRTWAAASTGAQSGVVTGWLSSLTRVQNGGSVPTRALTPLKAGWSYGVAPGAVTAIGTYQLRSGGPGRPGRMPAWLVHEVTRATAAPPPRPAAPPPPAQPGGSGPAAYLATVISRGATQLAAMTDGRKRTLSALAYHAGGLLAWSGQNREHVASQLTDVGTTAGLQLGVSVRIVNRALANGISRPVTPPGSRP